MRTVFGVVVCLLGVPALALACPVCGLAGTEGNATAYRVMTALMSALPLLMIGGIFVWVRGRVAADESGDTPDRPGRSPGPPGPPS